MVIKTQFNKNNHKSFVETFIHMVHGTIYVSRWCREIIFIASNAVTASGQQKNCYLRFGVDSTLVNNKSNIVRIRWAPLTCMPALKTKTILCHFPTYMYIVYRINNNNICFGFYYIVLTVVRHRLYQCGNSSTILVL